MSRSKERASSRRSEKETLTAKEQDLQKQQTKLSSGETTLKKHRGVHPKSRQNDAPESVRSAIPQQSSCTAKETGTDVIKSKRPETEAAKLLRAIKSYTPKKPARIADWRKASSYPINPNTEPAQWAWEFLRRNREFQKYCDSPESQGSSTDDPGTLRQQWGLASYKHYSKNYVPARPREEKLGMTDPSPGWGITQPARIIDRTSGPARHDATRIDPIDLEQGQMAVVFDLNQTNLELLTMQVGNAHEKLKLALARHQKLMETINIGVKTWSGKLLTCLRVADALGCANPPSRTEIGTVLFEDELVLKGKDPGKLGDNDFSRAIDHHIKVAHQLIYERGYLRLLVTKKAIKKRSSLAPKKRS